jgi:hypothetical protein
MNSLVFLPRRSLWFRVFNIACAIIVSSYLLFDVLDLDGSQRAPTPAGKSEIFIAENVTDINPVFTPILGELKFGIFPEVQSSSEILASVYLARELKFSGLKASRRHRIALPRSSVSDPSSSVQA